MVSLRKLARRLVLFAGMGLVTLTGTGCTSMVTPFWNGTLGFGFLQVAVDFAQFWKTTPLIPVSPYYSQLIEDTYHEEERYTKVPILDPVEGEHAPLFCLDPPSSDEVVRALPSDKPGGGIAFFAETSRNNLRIVVEPIVDRLGECRFFPMVGPARIHHCHYKCTVFYDKHIRSDWPVPFSHMDQTEEVVYIDHDHLIRCAGPPSN